MAEKEGALDLRDLEELREIGREVEGEAIMDVAVVGGGTMGRGIAHALAAKGINVILIEKNEEAAKRSREQLEEDLDHEIQRWALTESDKRAILARIQMSTDLDELERYDVVIEAITENLQAKQDLFRRLDEVCPPETIFVTNTSTLSITEIAAATRREDRVIGMHFLNPVPKVPLVEIVRGLKTSDETFENAKRLAERLGKTAVEVYEYPGYVTTRVIVTMLNEAMHILMEGVASAEGIDTAMKLGFNFPVGPLTLADMMGLDEGMAGMETLFRELGDMKYRPCPLLRKLVRAGHLGKKTGRGFFVYDETGKKIGVAQ